VELLAPSLVNKDLATLLGQLGMEADRQEHGFWSALKAGQITLGKSDFLRWKLDLPKP
jgi:hypothetical protein